MTIVRHTDLTSRMLRSQHRAKPSCELDFNAMHNLVRIFPVIEREHEDYCERVAYSLGLASRGYRITKVVGMGSYGLAITGFDRNDNVIILKISILELSDSDALHMPEGTLYITERSNFLRSATIMKTLMQRGVAVPQAIDVYQVHTQDGNEIGVFVMSAVPGVQLFRVAQSTALKNDKLLLLLRAMNTLVDAHKCLVVHGDAHCGNFLFDGHQMSLIDFDQSKLFKEETDDFITLINADMYKLCYSFPFYFTKSELVSATSPHPRFQRYELLRGFTNESAGRETTSYTAWQTGPTSF